MKTPIFIQTKKSCNNKFLNNKYKVIYKGIIYSQLMASLLKYLFIAYNYNMSAI